MMRAPSGHREETGELREHWQGVSATRARRSMGMFKLSLKPL